MRAKRKATASKGADTALGACAFLPGDATMQVVSEAKDNIASLFLANRSMSSNQCGEGEIRRARSKFCPGQTSVFSAN